MRGKSAAASKETNSRKTALKKTAESARAASRLADDPYRRSSLNPPSLRGWSHLLAAPFAVAGFVYLLVRAPEGGHRTVLALYGWSLLQMFVVSAVFHRGRWSDTGWMVMRKIDHLAIFFLIAGSNAAIIGLGAQGSVRVWVPGLALGLIAVGIVLRLFVSYPPFGLMNGVFLAVGGVGLFALPSLTRNLGPLAAVLIVIGVVLYGAGALCLGARFPAPQAKTFGYHEVWHLNVIGAAACHYCVVAFWILPAL